MGVLAGVSSDVWMTSTPSVTATNESFTDSGDHINYTASVHPFMDIGAGITVQNSPNGSSSWVTVTDYTVQWAIGKIVFNTARVPGTNNFVRANFNYFLATQYDWTSKWALSLKGNVAKTTSFQATGQWETYLATTRGGTGKIDTFRNDDRLSKEIGNILVAQLFVDKGNNVRWQCYIRVTDVSPATDAQNMQTQSISFSVERDAFFLTS